MYHVCVLINKLQLEKLSEWKNVTIKQINEKKKKEKCNIYTVSAKHPGMVEPFIKLFAGLFANSGGGGNVVS